MIEVITVKLTSNLSDWTVKWYLLYSYNIVVIFFLFIVDYALRLSLLHVILQFLDFQSGPSLSESSFCTTCYSLTLFAEQFK